MRFLILPLLVLLPSVLFAEKHSIRVIGREQVTVTTSEIRISDLAEIEAGASSDSDSVITLGKIVVAESPQPGDSKTISATEVLSKLRVNGADLEQIGYALPRVIRVERASRKLRKSEIRNAIEDYLRSSPYSDRELLDVSTSRQVVVSPGATQLRVLNASKASGKGMSFNILAQGDDGLEKRFTALGQVEEWIEVPVASRPLFNGSVVAEGDLMRARLKSSSLPRDVARDESQILGFEARGTIGYGEVFRKRKLIIPPIVDSGSRINLMYRSKFLEATASGIALESGAEGDQIRVRNDSSQKIISGIIREAGIVEVRK